MPLPNTGYNGKNISYGIGITMIKRRWLSYISTPLFIWPLLTTQLNAIEAGSYYYFISDFCNALGPIHDEVALDEITPDVKLFDVVPAGISDYNVHMNTEALSNYTSEGKALLQKLEDEQVYTAGINPKNSAQIFHNFMLQREAISFSQLVSMLNSFSQDQTLKGQYYRKLLTTKNNNSRYKAVTTVQLVKTENQFNGVLFLSQYRTDFYHLNGEGVPMSPVYIRVNHRQALSNNLHSIRSEWARTTENGVCGIKLKY